MSNAMNARETAWRIFAGELNASTFEKKGEGEKAVSYVVSPLGTMINRAMVAGVLMEKENRGTEEEPMWYGRIQDVSGSFYFNAGKFQPEAAASMASLDAPCFVVMVCKVRTFTNQEGRTFVSLRPEHIIKVEEPTRNLWVLEAAKSLWERLLKMKKCLETPDATVNDLIGKGYTAQEAEGMTLALDHYGFPQSERYLKMIQDAMKLILQDDSIDLGLPQDESDLPDEIEIPTKKEEEKKSGDNEDIILAILRELDDSSRGAPIDEVNRRAEMEGIDADTVESVCSALMDKGLVYEPNLGYLKLIDE